MTSSYCWHCHIHSQMIHVTDNEEYGLMDSDGIIDECYPDQEIIGKDNIPNTLLYIYTCANCGYPNIGEISCSAGLNNTVDLDKVIRWIPIEPIGKEYPDVPEKIALVASEVHKCLEIGANRATVILARTALEGIVGAQTDIEGSLYNRLAELSKKGELKGRTAEVADIIRKSGNMSVHDINKDVDKEFAEIVVELLDWVIDDLYSKPELINRASAYL